MIAQRVLEEFHRLGYLPQAPAVFRTTAWTRSATVTTRAEARKLTLTWDDQALTGVHVWMRRVGAKARILPGIQRGGSYTTPRLVRGARYQFRIRARESTPFGPLATIKVPRSLVPPPVSQVHVTAKGITWTRSPGATRYVVTYRRGPSTTPTVKPTVKKVRGLSLSVTGVSVASVRATNKHGKSAGADRPHGLLTAVRSTGVRSTARRCGRSSCPRPRCA